MMFLSILIVAVMASSAMAETPACRYFNADTKCPYGWNYYRIQNTCIQWFDIKRSFSDARDFCANFDADLIEVMGWPKRDFALSFAKSTFWNGVWDKDHNGKWRYVNTPMTANYHPWVGGEPNNASGNDFCVTIKASCPVDGQSDIGKWSTSDCNEKFNVICEKRAA